MNQQECRQCEDFLNMIDFEGRHVCPICFSRCKDKKDSACELLEKISKSTTDDGLKKQIKEVLDMRNW